MKISKTVISALVLAGATLGSHAAYADDISNAPEAIVLEDNSAFFGALFRGNNMGNTFSDQYSFTVTSDSVLSADLISFQGLPTLGLDITGFDIYNADGWMMAGTMVETGTTDIWNLSGINLAAGDYYVQVTGSVLSQSSGKYYADIALAPVPEPETYGMLLGGLGLLGFTARRRKHKKSA